MGYLFCLLADDCRVVYIASLHSLYLLAPEQYEKEECSGMNISRQMKGVFSALILIMVILVVVPQFMPDIKTSADLVSDNSSYPAIVRTIFGLWWVPIAMIMIGVVLSATGGAKGLGRRLRRRR